MNAKEHSPHQIWDSFDPAVLDERYGVYAVGKGRPILAGMPYPVRKEIWNHLHDLGLHSVVCLTHRVPFYDPAPLNLLAATKLDDLIGGRSPNGLADQEHRIRETVGLILAELTVGRSVVIHCAGGTGRTGTVLACVLRALGKTVGQVQDAMDVVNEIRGRTVGG